jgi:hypothetical protein
VEVIGEATEQEFELMTRDFHMMAKDPMKLPLT